MAEDRKKASSAGRELGRLGAKKGGRARARALTPAERSEIARRAVQARWAKAGRGVAATDVKDARAGGEVRSLYRGPLAIAGFEFEVHVLNNGQRVLDRDGVVEAFTGATDPAGLDRVLGKLPELGRRTLAVPTVSFRVPGRRATVVGLASETVLAIADAFLAARVAGPLKKQPARSAAVAESFVRATAAAGLVGRVDDATGYAKVRARQSAQRTLQAFIAEDLGRWASRFPKEFWAELARLDGATSAKGRSIAWSRYVLLFVYDAVDPDVGRELRRAAGDPAFRPSVAGWLEEMGRSRLDSRMDSIVEGLRRCGDLDEFTSMFAKVLHKGPSHTLLLDDDGPVLTGAVAAGTVG